MWPMLDLLFRRAFTRFAIFQAAWPIVPGYAIVSLILRCSGQASLVFRLAARGPVYSRTGPVYIRRRPRRFLSVIVLI